MFCGRRSAGAPVGQRLHLGRRNDPTQKRQHGWQNENGLGDPDTRRSACNNLKTTPRLAATVQLRTYIVEDNATIRENLIGTLEELACIQALGWAETESQAKGWLSENDGRWDLTIVDLFLKQGSGLGVLEACRGRPASQRVDVLSNYATTDMRKRCAQLGADAVFDKSNEIDALVDYCIAQSEAPRPGA
jgi:two-component system OmpR family response regulator